MDSRPENKPRRLLLANNNAHIKWTPACGRKLHVDSKWKTSVSTSMLLHALSRNKLYNQHCRQRRKQGGLSDLGVALKALPRQVFFTLRWKTAFWLAVYAESRHAYLTKRGQQNFLTVGLRKSDSRAPDTIGGSNAPLVSPLTTDINKHRRWTTVKLRYAECSAG